MIPDSNLPFEHEEFFSNPESLEQLRDNLMTLFYQQQNNFSCVINGLRHISVPFQQQRFSQINLNELYQYIKELEEQFRQRTNNVSTLVNLSTKMIDFIIEERYRTMTLVEGYEAQIEEYRINIDSLTNTKNVIQSDVDFFREQLQAARNELEDIIEEKQEEHQHEDIQRDAIQYEIEKQLQKDRKIQILQVELEKIKEELKLYKFESSNHKLHIKYREQNQLSGCSSPKGSLSNLRQKRRSEIVGQAEKDNYLYSNRQLVEENQLLQEQIQLLREKTVRQFKINSHENIVQAQTIVRQSVVDNHQIDDRLPPVLQTNQKTSAHLQLAYNLCVKFISPNKSIVQLFKFEDSKQQVDQGINLKEGRQGRSWLSKNTSLTLIKKTSQKSIQQSSQRFQYVSPREIKLEDIEELERNSSANQFHCLSSEWSAKSFEYNICNPCDLLSSNQAIYLTEDDHSKTSVKVSLDIEQYINTEETKNTESSIKAFSTQGYIQGIATERSYQYHEGQEATQWTQKKMSCSMVKNFQKKKKVEQQQVKKASSGFFESVFNYVVGNRVRKHCKK